MSTNSNDKGRAYEYAWMCVLYETISELRDTSIANNSSLSANERAWNSMSEDEKTVFLKSAYAAVDLIVELEPKSIEDDGDVLLLEFQQDDAGTKGDVRDIVLRRNAEKWEVGLSIKHNHEAVKHSRLSHGLDFGNEWYGIPCSKSYWSEVKPIFDMLKYEKSNGTKWSELGDKVEVVYIPLLQAFINEINRAYEKDPGMPTKMIEYLIGIKDYHKVVSMDSKKITLIHTFNIHNTLNKPSKCRKSSIEVPVVELPTELVAVKFKKSSNNTVEVYFNNGWQLSFRIHNASSKVEPSLKFDIQFMGMPITITTIECRWK